MFAETANLTILLLPKNIKNAAKFGKKMWNARNPLQICESENPVFLKIFSK